MALPPSSIQKWKIPVRNGPDLGGKVTTSKSRTRKNDLHFEAVRLKIQLDVRSKLQFQNLRKYTRTEAAGCRKRHTRNS
jgi:hypothetical protein